MLFGIPDHKDECGSEAYAEHGVVQEAMRALKARFPELYLIGDVCMCEYTSHGHCGILHGHDVDNDEDPAATSPGSPCSQVEAGADMVAPSDMMDGRIAAIRAAAGPGRPHQHAHHVLRRQVRVLVLRPVPGRRRVGAQLRRPQGVPDGLAQPARGL